MPIIRTNITLRTLNRIKEFLEQQEEQIYKTDIVKKLKVDYNSLNYALTFIDPKLLKKIKEY